MAQILPKISRFQDASSYFQEFFDKNKKNQKSFSHRQFAKKIGWPASYLHDVMTGRKKFTIVRAIQFAQFTKMDSISTERLIYFAIREESLLDVQQFAKQKLEKNVASEKKLSTLDRTFFEHIEYEAVLRTLVWAGRRLMAQEIKTLLYTMPQLSLRKIENVIKDLEKKSWITFDKKGTVLNFTDDIFLDEHGNSHAETGIHIHTQYAQSFLQFTKTPQIPGMYNSGFFEVPRKDFMEIAQRLLETRNWFVAHCKHLREKPKEKTTDTLVFQIDLNLFTIFDKSKIDVVAGPG